MSYTKKVITKWQADSYIQAGPSDREGANAAALDELDAKIAEMSAQGKMSAESVDSVVAEDALGNLISIKLFKDQSAAEEWVTWTNTFAAKYGFVKRSSLILSN